MQVMMKESLNKKLLQQLLLMKLLKKLTNNQSKARNRGIKKERIIKDMSH